MGKNGANDKPIAYYKAVVHNSLKNEYRQNDNAAKHITPVGLTLETYAGADPFDGDFDAAISVRTPEDWLQTIGDEHLYASLRGLCPDDFEFVFELFTSGMTQKQYADFKGVSKQAIGKRWARIRKVLQDSLNRVDQDGA